METVRETWTDERLDDLRDGVADFRREANEEFAALRQEFVAVRQETKEEFAAVRQEFVAVRQEMKEEFRAVRHEMQDGFSALNTRFDALQRTIIQVGGGMAAAFGAALIGLIATQL